MDPHAGNYPHLSPYVYAANNPLLYIDPDGRDYVLHFDKEDQSITVAANYYTTETGAASAREATAFWNDQGMTTEIEGVEYTVSFDLKVEIVDQSEIAGLVADDPGGNSWEIVADGSLGENVFGGVSGGNRVMITESHVLSQETGAHEVGHTLGMPHNQQGGVMAGGHGNVTLNVMKSDVFFMVDSPLRGRQLRAPNNRGVSVPMGKGTIPHGTHPGRRR